MLRTRTIGWVLLVLGLGICAAAQTPQPDTTPVPAFGQNAPVLNPENPPVSGIDEPTLQLRTASQSFVSTGLEVSESGDTNGNNNFGSSDIESISRILGAFDLQQFWPKSDLFLEYLGGGAFYSNPYVVKQMHSAGLEGVTRWRTGQVTLRDSFSYLPDGSFNIGFGGFPGLGIATGTGLNSGQVGSLPGLHTFNTGGSIGNTPRLSNSAILDVVQAINPVSAFTVVGAFGNAHFFDNADNLVNSDQISTQVGYSHLLSRHDQLGVVYGFQLFQFPQSTGGQVFNHVVNLRWSRTLSGRMSLIVGAGPQYTDLQQGGYFQHWSLSARVQLRYRFAHSSLGASYEKFTSPGSGFFAGAETQAARLSFTRPVGRTWEFMGDLGYSYNKKLQDIANAGVQGASAYNEGSVLAVLRKHLGRKYDFFAAYRFSEVGFNNTATLGAQTGTISQRQSGTIGVEWHPAPTRIE